MVSDKKRGFATASILKVFFLILIVLFSVYWYNFPKPKAIGIYTYMVAGATPWDPDSIRSGITGSEEAVIYMAEQLVQHGNKVTVFGNPPPQSAYSHPDANPRYVPLNSPEPEVLDIAVSWRMPDAAERLKTVAKKVYLWPHDTCHTTLTESQILGFDDVFWLSHWQRQQWMSVNPPFQKFTGIFGNGINLKQFQPITERTNPYSCIYGSNYGRGLEILLDIWPEIKKQFPKATLDIYYGWQHWGLLTHAQERKMRSQIALLAPLDVKEHGLVGHEELNRAYEKASFWVYPCIAPEVFCITALRAQFAGAIPVIINGTALTETVRSGYRCASPEAYPALLKSAMNNAESITLEDRQRMGQLLEQEYTWKAVADKWMHVFNAQ